MFAERDASQDTSAEEECAAQIKTSVQAKKIASFGKTVKMEFVWKISIHALPFASQDIIAMESEDVYQFPSISAELKEIAKSGKTASMESVFMTTIMIMVANTIVILDWFQNIYEPSIFYKFQKNIKIYSSFFLCIFEEIWRIFAYY